MENIYLKTGRQCLLIFLALCLPVGIIAQSVSIKDAERVALRFANRDSRVSSKIINKSESISLFGKAPLYLISMNEGWVLVSSERAATPILAESPTGIFPTFDEMPDGMKWLLSYYEAALQYARDSLHEDIENKDWEYWLNDESNMNALYTRDTHILDRLAEVQWNQSSNNSNSNYCIKPYNYYCPTWVQPSCDHAYVGCTAVAMGQVMWYYQWPHSAIVPACMNDSNGNVCGSIKLAEYDWDLMPSALYSYSPWEQVYETAAFLRDCGYSCHMGYKHDGSYASIADAQTALTQNFHYQSMYLCRKDDYPYVWTGLLKYRINNDQPIIYSGYNSEGTHGHTFVIFGYENNLFRINWGWGGFQITTLYTLSPLEPFNGYDYSYSQYALLGIRPNYPSCTSPTIMTYGSENILFEVYEGEEISLYNLTISSVNNGVIYAGQQISLQSPFTIQSGANVHLAIKEMHCELSELDNNSSLSIEETDSITDEEPERYNLPAASLETVPSEENIPPTNTDDVPYNVLGQPVDENYKGIVIQNGKKKVQ